MVLPMIFGGGGGDFEPDDLTGLAYWYRADRSVTKDGSNLVAGWGDLSVNGRNLAQATAGKKPLWVDNLVNGRPAIRFDGTDDELFLSSVAQVQPIHLFVVCRSLAVAGGADRVWSTSPTSAAGTTEPNLIIRSGPSMALQANNLDGASVASDLTAFHLYSCAYNGTSSTITKDNGTAATSTANLAGSGASIIVGGGHNNWANCEVAELFAYLGGIKSGTDAAKVRNYIRRRYALW